VGSAGGGSRAVMGYDISFLDEWAGWDGAWECKRETETATKDA